MRATCRLAVFLAFFVAQAILSAHSAAHGDAPHSHDGQACVLALASSQAEMKSICGDAPVLPRRSGLIAIERAYALASAPTFLFVDLALRTRAPPFA